MGFLDSLFGGGKNPADAAMPYIEQIPGKTKQYYEPFYEAGKNALPLLQDQYTNLLNNPGDKLNNIGTNYSQSPGLKFAIEQAMQGANHAAAAGGMAGSPAHEQQNIGLATNLANQDYYKWLDSATNLYSQGLHGQEGLVRGGQQAGSSMADMIAQAMAQQADLAFRGQQEKNSQNSSLWNGIGKIGGAGIGALVGGPWGAFAGWNMS